MKAVLLGLLFCGFANADVGKVMDTGKVSDIPNDAKVCVLAVDGEVSALVTCDNKIRIGKLTDLDSPSRGSTISTYTYLLGQRGYALKSCMANANVNQTFDKVGTTIVNYCIFEK